MRIVKPNKEYTKYLGKSWHDHNKDNVIGQRKDDTKGHRTTAQYQTIGWTDCHCNAGWAPGITFDPFSGAGTTAKIAKQLGKHFVGVEIKKEYVEMSEKRLQNVQLELMT